MKPTTWWKLDPRGADAYSVTPTLSPANPWRRRRRRVYSKLLFTRFLFRGVVRHKHTPTLIAGREYFYSYAKTFANVKFSICTGKERVFSVKGCVLSKQVVNLTLASLCVRVKVLPSSDQHAHTPAPVSLRPLQISETTRNARPRATTAARPFKLGRRRCSCP